MIRNNIRVYKTLASPSSPSTFLYVLDLQQAPCAAVQGVDTPSPLKYTPRLNGAVLAYDDNEKGGGQYSGQTRYEYKGGKNLAQPILR